MQSISVIIDIKSIYVDQIMKVWYDQLIAAVAIGLGIRLDMYDTLASPRDIDR